MSIWLKCINVYLFSIVNLLCRSDAKLIDLFLVYLRGTTYIYSKNIADIYDSANSFWFISDFKSDARTLQLLWHAWRCIRCHNILFSRATYPFQVFLKFFYIYIFLISFEKFIQVFWIFLKFTSENEIISPIIN
jgi:hypothetical protein